LGDTMNIQNCNKCGYKNLFSRSGRQRCKCGNLMNILYDENELHFLNVGCGKDIRKGCWINLDRYNRYGANCVWDLNKLPLPFKDNTFDYILCSHVLEDFTEPLPIIYEFARITKEGGEIEIRVPNETINNCSIHHKKAFNAETFRLDENDDAYGEQSKLHIKKLEYYAYENNEKLSYFGRTYRDICTFFANLLGTGVMTYTFFKCLFPAINIKVIYVKKKN